MNLAPDKITVDKEGLVRIDGQVIFRLTTDKNNTKIIQFCDKDRLRSQCRGDRLMNIPFKEFIEHLDKLLEPTSKK